MSFKYCLILLVQEHEHFIQHHYFWNNLVYEWRQTIGGLGHASDESWIIVYACSVMLVCWPNAGNAVSTLVFHTAGQPHLSFVVLQWYFSVLVLLGLSACTCFFWQASLGWSCIFRATMKLRNDAVYWPLVHSINIHHLSTESMNNLLWMNNDMYTGG